MHPLFYVWPNFYLSVNLTYEWFSKYTGLVIGEPYRSDVSPEYAIRGNSVLFKCSIPPFVADFVSVISWIDDAGNNYYNVNDHGAVDYGTCSIII